MSDRVILTCTGAGAGAGGDDFIKHYQRGDNAMSDYSDFSSVHVCADCLMVSEGYGDELAHEPAPTDAAEWIIEPLDDYAPHYGSACDFCLSPHGLGDTYKARAERRPAVRAGARCVEPGTYCDHETA